MNNLKVTNTAYKAWDEKWKNKEGIKEWGAPSPEVVNVLKILEKKQAKVVLDLGSGVGRHSKLLAEAGYKVHALDGSITGVNYLNEFSDSLNLSVEAICAEMTTLPYSNSFFDYILAWNVIYHGNLSVIQRVLSEIIRVLKPGGIFQFTMLSKRNIEFSQGVQIDYNTMIIEGGLLDKNHPHFYCNSMELMQLLVGFEIISLQDTDDIREGLYHWQIVAEKIIR